MDQSDVETVSLVTVTFSIVAVESEAVTNVRSEDHMTKRYRSIHMQCFLTIQMQMNKKKREEQRRCLSVNNA